MVAEQILRLQIPVKEVLLVHVSQALQSLEKYVPNDVLGEELAPILHDLKHVLVEVLEYEVKCLVLKYDLLEIDDVGVG